MDEMPDEFFSSVIDAAPDGMLIVDGDGVIAFANRQAVELFGTAHDELVGSSVDRLLPDNLQAVHRAHRLRYRAEPTVRPMGVGLLLRARRGDGTEFPVEVSLSPLSRQGSFYVVAAVRDVTARVEAEDRMRRVLQTLDATEEALFILDRETLTFEYVNDGASRQVGYARDELLGMTPMHLNPVLSEQELREAIADLRPEEHSAVNLRTVHRRRDGTDVPVEVTLHTAPPAQDGSVSLILVARDISGRLEAEEQLRRSERAVREAEQVMAVADDRERIARDLHDTVIQRLFASGLALQAITPRVEAEVKQRLEGIVDDLDQTIREIRTAIFSLQAPAPAEGGLRRQILDVVGDAAHNLGFDPRLVFEGPIETMDDEVAAHLVPTLREALTNVAKHASASTVHVIVEVRGGEAVLTVRDDGRGLPAPGRVGHGLENMSTRAIALGGSCIIEPGNPSGTCLIWRVPSNLSASPVPAAGRGSSSVS